MTRPAPDRPPTSGKGRLITAWTAATLIGEMLGLGLAGAIGTAVVAMTSSSFGFGAWSISTAAAGIAGLLEGGIAGACQWLVLRRTRLSSIGARRWVVATAIGGAIPWVIGMGAGSAGPNDAEPPGFAAIATIVVAAGALFGGILGTAQSIAMRRHVYRIWRWASANAAGWALGLGIVMAATSVVSESTSVAVVVVLTASSGLAAGTLVGIVTGALLGQIVDEPPLDQALQSAAPPP